MPVKLILSTRMQSFHKVSKLCDYDGLSHKLLEGELHFTSLLAHIA